MNEPQWTERECGDCQACCSLFEITALNKPPRQRCEHQCKKGCAIYSERPQQCEDYRCRWLQGDPQLSQRDRPDRLGVVFDQRGGANPLVEGIKHTFATELRPGAFKQKRPAAWIRALLSDRLVVQVSFSGKQRVAGPQALVDEFNRRVAAADR